MFWRQGARLSLSTSTARSKLTSDERLWAIRSAGPRFRRPLTAAALLKEDLTFQHDFLTIDLAPFLHKTRERFGRLEKARAMVVTSPEVLGGTAVIRGTRVPVYDVAASVAAGLPMDRILAAYPSLDADKVELAMLYAEANPRRGRPRHGSDLPKGAVVITDRRMPRRRKAG